jgi:hypothetical protein
MGADGKTKIVAERTFEPEKVYGQEKTR